MDVFIGKLVSLVNQSKGWLQQLGVPVLVVAGLFFTIMFSVSSDQNKGKYKTGLIVVVVCAILFAAIVYIIPWFYSFFQ